jgi:hypothetical protein
MSPILKHLKHGNIVRITHEKERFVVIINSIPKHITVGEPKLVHTNPNSRKSKSGNCKNIINVSTQFNNHLSSVLQRKFLKEVELEIEHIQVSFVTLDEYKEIQEYIFDPNICSGVRNYFENQKMNNLKLIKRVLKSEGNNAIKGSMSNRPSDRVEEFNPKVLTTQYETEMDRKAVQQKSRRQLMLKRARNLKKDPIEQYKNKQKMERRKQQRAEKKVNPNMFK